MKVDAMVIPEKGAKLQPFSFEMGEITGYDCLIKVLTCGVCHSDVGMIDNEWGFSQYPLVPGHEIVGEVLAVGEKVEQEGVIVDDNVEYIKVGDRLGVGWQGGSCLHCLDCLRGNENLCTWNQPLLVGNYGGYAKYLKVDSRFAFKIPSGIETDLAGPLMCAGTTVYSALRAAGMSSGQEIGVIGIGGLGHIAVQFASKLGNRVTMFTGSPDKAEYAKKLGADQTIIVPKGESPAAPKHQLDLILSTAPEPIDWSGYLEHLTTDGTFMQVGLFLNPMSIPLWPLVVKRRRFMSSTVGGRSTIREMLTLAEEYGIRPIVEIFPLEEANQAIDKLRSNQMRFRGVLRVS
ncbi:MAG: NAD(P)-dependent alcohol dehydrogenase [Xenococcaceae cyanobacterium MO_188.B29]|nr:NAD(P)-dependent alcohol dehydrogenase [Xenococcaceae cyanobacterium MO_188.B29]